MIRRWAVLAAASSALALVAPAAATDSDRLPRSSPGRDGWALVHQENFSRPLSVNEATWVRDPMASDSPWAVDQFDDDGEVWHAISDPDFTEQISTLDVYRKRVPFGADGWLTAEIAAVDKDRDGSPDSEPGLSTVDLGHGESAAKIEEPSWDAGVLIRPTDPLPARYRVEMTLRGIDFGGKRNGKLRYDGKYNGYVDTGCKTAFPWTFRGAAPGKGRCDYGQVVKENGFYYLTILDHANPAPHGNPGIHFRRKIIMDGYNSLQKWSRPNAICNPKTGELYSTLDGNYNAVNAIFVRGDKFRAGNNNVSNEYFFRTPCGDFAGEQRWGPEGQYRDLASSVELQPELLPQASYTFAVERDATGYTIEMRGPFRYVGEATYRFRHDFVEDRRPIWHYNQTPQEYDGAFDRSLTHTGPSGSFVTEHTWPAGSAYPDSFIIGDPHLNFYEGSALVDDIRLYVPES
jgi:hypothetical protein